MRRDILFRRLGRPRVLACLGSCLVLWTAGQSFDYGRSKLIKAIYAGDIDKVSALLRDGGDVNASSLDGTTPLMAASATCNFPVVRILLAHGAEPNKADIRGHSALYFVATVGRTTTAMRIFSELRAAGAVMDSKTRQAKESMNSAAEHGELGIVQDLLRDGVEVDSRDEGGRTALMLAAREGQPRAVIVLARNGASVDARDADGRTALMYAAYNGQEGAVWALTSLGANTQLKDKDGSTAVDYANSQKHFDLAGFLSRSAFRF